VLDFILEEIKAISESYLKSYGYAPYIMYMIERVTARTFGWDKEHQSLKIKNDLKALVEERRTTAQLASPPHRAARRGGQQGEKSPSPIWRMLGVLFGICKSQHAVDVRAHHERQAQKKDSKSIKEMHAHLNLQALALPLVLRPKKAPR
jgi:hypothetical protein